MLDLFIIKAKIEEEELKSKGLLTVEDADKPQEDHVGQEEEEAVEK